MTDRIKGRLRPQHTLKFGKLFDNRYPLVPNIWAKGVPIDDGTVTAIRQGNTSGDAIQLGVFASEILERNFLNRTYQRLHDIAKVGTQGDVRTTLEEKQISFRFKSDGFIQILSHNIGEKGEHPQTIEALLEAARAICVYELIERPDQFSDYFIEMENRLYEHMSQPHGRRDDFICQLHERGIDDPLDWFKAVYKDRSRSRWFGKLTPYQMEFFKGIMEGLSQIDGIDRFSKQVLEYKRGHEVQMNDVIDRVGQETGIPITPAAVELFFHLIYFTETGSR